MRDRDWHAALQVRQVSSQRLGDKGGRRKAAGGLFLVQSVDECRQPVGDIGIHLAKRSGPFVAHPAQNGGRRAGAEWRMAGAHEVENAAQAEQVGAMIDGLAAGLLGRHVLGVPVTTPL